MNGLKEEGAFSSFLMCFCTAGARLRSALALDLRFDTGISQTADGIP